MKKIFLFIATVCLLSACEQDLPLYDDETARLNFVYENVNRTDTISNYSFVYHKQVEQDTVWFEVETMGFLSDKDRYCTIYQEPTGNNDAEAGVHYVSFDDPTYKKLLVIPADSVNAKIPVIVLNDESLKEKVVTLKIRIGTGEDFAQGFKDATTKILYITNKLQKPELWSSLFDWYFGDYGTVKHQFMIDVTGKDWDDEYITEQGLDDMYTADQNYMMYLQSVFSKALAEENAKRLAQGLSYLAEEDGTIVSFDF